MPRGYRGIVLAAFGFLILGAKHPQPSAKPEQAEADYRIGDALTNIARTYDEQAKRAESSPEGQPCQPGQDNRLSDLCAQWKAADAADTAAWWARVSGALSIVGLFGVGGALLLTIQSNRLARRTANQQLRAWMRLEAKIGPDDFAWIDDSCFASVRFNAENVGSTPALDTLIVGTVFIGGNIEAEVRRFSKSIRSKRTSLYPDTIFPGTKMKRDQVLSFDPESAEMVAPTIIAIAQYRTIFDGPDDVPHQTIRVWDLTIRNDPKSALYKSMTPIMPGSLQIIANIIHPGQAD